MILAQAVRACVLPLVATLALVATSAAAAPATTLKPFTASYDVNYMGLAGTGTMRLASAGGDRWRYSLDINSAIANLSQNTMFEANGGNWRPLSNTDSANLLIKKHTKQATYDWGKREARWSGDVKSDRTGPVALRDGDLDAMLVNLAIPRDFAANGGGALDYRMVDDGRARAMHYQVAGKDTIDIGGTSRQATKLSRSEGDKQQLVWLVDGLPVPARILQRRNGKDEMDLRLKSIK